MSATRARQPRAIRIERRQFETAVQLAWPAGDYRERSVYDLPPDEAAEQFRQAGWAYHYMGFFFGGDERALLWWLSEACHACQHQKRREAIERTYAVPGVTEARP